MAMVWEDRTLDSLIKLLCKPLLSESLFLDLLPLMEDNTNLVARVLWVSTLTVVPYMET
jgi:hypothetical protein